MDKIKKSLVIHENEGETEPDMCGTVIGLINRKTSYPQNVSVAAFIVEPGHSSQEHYHKKTEEIYYIINGLATMKIGDENFQVKPGHTILIPINELHQITNIGTEQLRFLAIDAPMFSDDDVFFS